MTEFVGYVGPSEIRDATIERVDNEPDRLVVVLVLWMPLGLGCGSSSRNPSRSNWIAQSA